jgi:hypothetical protein
MKITLAQQSACIVALGAILLAACGPAASNGDGGNTTDVRTGGSDAGADSGSRDSGPVNNDPCARDQMSSASGVGCNGGFVMGEPAANAIGGTCVPAADPQMNPRGSCTAMDGICAPDMMGAMTGRCIAPCTPGATYVSTGMCPSGFRCFDLGMGNGACFRDCNNAHACPMGMMCDGEGSCVR